MHARAQEFAAPTAHSPNNGAVADLPPTFQRPEPSRRAADQAEPSLPPAHTPLDAAMMARALDLARHAVTLGEIPVAAIVYETESGTLLGSAHNRRELDHDPSAHAEMLAIREAAAKLGSWRLTNCTLIVTLEPCCMCAGLIVNARLGRLVYGCDDPKAGAVCSLHRLTTDQRLNHRVEPIRGVLAEESSQLLRDFFRARRT